MILVLYVLVGMLFVGGLVVMGEAWRRRPSFPACRSCGYNLTGHAKRGQRCPECGQHLNERTVLPPRQVQFHGWLMAIGIAMVALSLPFCCYGTIFLG